MNLPSLFNSFARKILYIWVKTTVIPNDLSALGINPELPVIYVLESRSWSNLLVLEQQCETLDLPPPLQRINSAELQEWYSVYTIAPRQPFKAWINKQPKRSRMLRGLVEKLDNNPELEIQFVPVSIFWGRPVANQKHWLQALFADSWALAGRTRTFFRIIFQGRNTFLQYSEIIAYRSDASTSDVDKKIDALQDTFSKRLRKIRTATLGPDVSHQRTLVRDLILNSAVQTAIQKRSTEDNLTDYQATLQARRYLNEIVANCSNVTIQVLQRLLSWFWNKFYSGVEVSNADYLKNLALSHELVYVPCHRSHIDYLLLSYVIYHQGLAIPYVAAGKNLNMPVIGSVLRGGGAFFIRRTFKGNELYSTVMFEYLAKLIAMGVPIEYFIEGGRSRTGRLIQAKPGMLAMTVRGFLQYRQRPIAFIPVNIAYEKLLESKAYQAELSGEAKKSETFISSVKSILRIRGEFGKVYTNFGKPVFLNQILDHQHPAWMSEEYNDKNRPKWLRDVIGTLSTQIMTHINQAVTVGAVNLISCVLLATQKQSMDETELVTLLEMYQKIIRDLDYSGNLNITQRTGKEQISHVESLKMVKRRTHELGDIIYLDAKHAVSLTYYRNNILHLMALPSIIACCFFNVRTLSRDEISSLVLLAYPFIQKELFISWDKEQALEKIHQILDDLVAQNLLIKSKESDDIYSRPPSNTVEFTRLTLLAKIISPILEVFYLTLAMLSRSNDKAGEVKISKQELENNCALMAQRVAMIHELNSPDYSDKKLISNFIDTLIHIDYVKVFNVEDLVYSDVFHRTDKRIRLLLPKETRSNILQMISQQS